MLSAVLASCVCLLSGPTAAAAAPETVTKYRRGLNDPDGLVVGDVNGDGQADLVTGNFFGGFQVLLGRVGGQFGPVVRSRPRDEDAKHELHAIGDFDEDRDLDLIAVERSEFDIDDDGPQRVVIAFGDGRGRFRQRRLPLLDGARDIPFVRSADLDHDGHRDVLALETLESFETRLTVLLGTGAGGFGPRQVHALDGVPPPGLISDHDRMQITDVNRDRAVDVVLNDRVLFNDGSGRFRQQPLDVGRVFALGDLNSDGAPDLVAGAEFSSPLRIALGTGDGTFQLAASTSRGGIPDLVADLSGDGRPDVLASDRSTVALYRGDGRGRLESAVKLRRARGYLVGVVIARSRRPTRARIVRLYGDLDVNGAGTVLARRVPVR